MSLLIGGDMAPEPLVSSSEPSLKPLLAVKLAI